MVRRFDVAKQKKPSSGSKKLPRLASRSSNSASPRLYTLEVFLIGGPIAAKFARKNRVISRAIQIRGDQTLADLHDAIFAAYDRFDEHMYEFQFGKRPMEGPRYVLAASVDNDVDESSAGSVEETAIDSLGLKKGRSFGYWFDFGDDWWHQIDVVAVEENVPPGEYPKITKRVGKSPPQYMEEEE
jgi:hypothetical protein